MASPPPDLVAPPWLEFLRRHIFVIAFILAAVTLTLIRPFTRHIPEPPPVMFELPGDWTLTDNRGETFSKESMHGKVWVASFVFTRCPSSCPAVTRAMQDLRDRFDRNNIDIKMVSFSVDPEYDTPAVLDAYATQNEIDYDKWKFVTGGEAAMTELLEGGFKLGLGPREEKEGGLFDIAHSTKLALIDKDGNVRGYYGIDPTPNEDGGLAELYERADRVDRMVPGEESAG